MRLRVLAVAAILLVSSSAFAYRTSAWMPLYATGGLESTRLNAGNLTESNPVWYQFGVDGKVVAIEGAEDSSWRAAMTGTEVLPTVQNLVNGGFDQAVAVAVLSTASMREAHAESIFQLVVAKGYDGIDIDYERLPYTTRDDFSAFLGLLAGKLHTAGKKLSVAVYAKTSDTTTRDGAGGHDLEAIGRHADFVKLMAYPYSYSGTEAGPLSPPEWIDQVVTYATSVIAPEKVMLGLPWYGKDWTGTTAKSLSWRKATDLAIANNATIGRDASGEAVFTYSTHTVVFNDLESYRRKIAVVLDRHPGIAGVAHWAAGQEDPAVWAEVGTLKFTGSGSAPSTPTPLPAPDPNLLIGRGSAWRYLDNGSDQKTAWRSTSFNDSAWKSGRGELGYGDYDEVTRISFGSNASKKHITTYFRRAFEVSDPAAFRSLALSLLRDDGAVVYLNGREVLRSNMPTGTIRYRTLASGDAKDEAVYLRFSVPSSWLVQGKNIVAVEIHQSSEASSDLSFDLELSGSNTEPVMTSVSTAKQRSVRR